MKPRTLVQRVGDDCPHVIVKNPMQDVNDWSNPERAIMCSWKELSEKGVKYLSFKTDCSEFSDWFGYTDDQSSTPMNAMVNRIAKNLGLESDPSIIRGEVVEKTNKQYDLVVKVSESALRQAYRMPEEKPLSIAAKIGKFFTPDCCTAETEVDSNSHSMEPINSDYMRMN